MAVLARFSTVVNSLAQRFAISSHPPFNKFTASAAERSAPQDIFILLFSCTILLPVPLMVNFV